MSAESQVRSLSAFYAGQDRSEARLSHRRCSIELSVPLYRNPRDGNGHGSGVPWLRQGRATSGAGTSIPTARNTLLRNGPELGEMLLSRQDFPGLGRMFMARPHRRALAFLGFWVRQAPCGTPRIGAVVDHLARRNRVAPSASYTPRNSRMLSKLEEEEKDGDLLGYYRYEEDQDPTLVGYR